MKKSAVVIMVLLFLSFVVGTSTASEFDSEAKVTVLFSFFSDQTYWFGEVIIADGNHYRTATFYSFLSSSEKIEEDEEVKFQMFSAIFVGKTLQDLEIFVNLATGQKEIDFFVLEEMKELIEESENDGWFIF